MVSAHHRRLTLRQKSLQNSRQSSRWVALVCGLLCTRVLVRAIPDRSVVITRPSCPPPLAIESALCAPRRAGSIEIPDQVQVLVGCGHDVGVIWVANSENAQK